MIQIITNNTSCFNILTLLNLHKNKQYKIFVLKTEIDLISAEKEPDILFES